MGKCNYEKPSLEIIELILAEGFLFSGSDGGMEEGGEV